MIQEGDECDREPTLEPLEVSNLRLCSTEMIDKKGFLLCLPSSNSHTCSFTTTEDISNIHQRLINRDTTLGITTIFKKYKYYQDTLEFYELLLKNAITNNAKLEPSDASFLIDSKVLKLLDYLNNMLNKRKELIEFVIRLIKMKESDLNQIDTDIIMMKESDINQIDTEIATLNNNNLDKYKRSKLANHYNYNKEWLPKWANFFHYSIFPKKSKYSFHGIHAPDSKKLTGKKWRQTQEMKIRKRKKEAANLIKKTARKLSKNENAFDCIFSCIIEELINEENQDLVDDLAKQVLVEEEMGENSEQK